ncbi:MAG TPA: hypothetical protein VFN60_07370 [Acidimicrobiales bacterium]|nr:hypothetical protein [Acidimicrobiales bacterium]
MIDSHVHRPGSAAGLNAASAALAADPPRGPAGGRWGDGAPGDDDRAGPVRAARRLQDRLRV